MTLRPTELVSIASFSLGLATLVLRFWIERPSAKQQSYIAAIVFFMLSGSILIFQEAQRANQVGAMRLQIVEILGNQEKTVDQLRSEMNTPDPVNFAEAFSQLQDQHFIDHRIEYLNVTHLQNQVQLWHVKSGAIIGN